MTDNDKIEAIIASLTENALGDIKRASSGGAKMGAFILCSCLIDAIAGFMKGNDTRECDYKHFVGKYMPAYDAEKIYTALRCKLVHSYSEGGSYWFKDNMESLHLSKLDNEKTIVNLENFIAEIESALQKYTSDLRITKNLALRNNAIKRYDLNGVIQVVPLEAFHFESQIASPNELGTTQLSGSLTIAPN